MDWKKAKAKDVMKRKVISVRPNQLVGECTQIFDDQGISGAPVVDGRGRLLGVISKSDLVQHQREGGGNPDRFSFYRGSGMDALPRGYHLESPDRTQVREVMTPMIIQAREDAPVTQIARLMRRKHIHRIFITDGPKLQGVVTTMDILKLFESGSSSRTKKAPRKSSKKKGRR